MSRPRILFITSDVPRNGGRGGQIASFRQIEAFAEHGTVDVVAIGPPYDVESPELERIARRLEVVALPHFHFARSRVKSALILAGSLRRREPFRIAKSRSAHAEEVLRTWLAEEDYDLVHCDYLSSAAYRPLAAGVPTTLTQHNIEWQQFAQLAERHRNPLARAVLRADSRITRSWEAQELDEFGHVFVLSEEDRQRLLQSRPDLADTISVWPIPIAMAPLPAPAGPPRFIALGTLTAIGRVHGLRWFMANVWAPLRARIPDARLDIVGSSPPPEIEAFDGVDGVRVHGFVEDLDPMLAATTACVIPLFIGSGIRVKVLEMISRAIPCVGSPVALQGLLPLEGCFEVAEPADWVETLAGIAADPEGSRRCSRAGAVQLAQEHSPEVASARVGEVLVRLGVAAAPEG